MQVSLPASSYIYIGVGLCGSFARKNLSIGSRVTEIQFRGHLYGILARLLHIQASSCVISHLCLGSLDCGVMGLRIEDRDGFTSLETRSRGRSLIYQKWGKIDRGRDFGLRLSNTYTGFPIFVAMGIRLLWMDFLLLGPVKLSERTPTPRPLLPDSSANYTGV